MQYNHTVQQLAQQGKIQLRLHKVTYLFIDLPIFPLFQRSRFNEINLQTFTSLSFIAFSIQETRNDFLDHENMEMLSIPSTSQGISNSSDVSISTEIVNDDNDDDEEEAESFNTQKLFSFAWQIAKGMVGTDITTQKLD